MVFNTPFINQIHSRCWRLKREGIKWSYQRVKFQVGGSLRVQTGSGHVSSLRSGHRTVRFYHKGWLTSWKGLEQGVRSAVVNTGVIAMGQSIKFWVQHHRALQVIESSEGVPWRSTQTWLQNTSEKHLSQLEIHFLLDVLITSSISKGILYLSNYVASLSQVEVSTVFHSFYTQVFQGGSSVPSWCKWFSIFLQYCLAWNWEDYIIKENIIGYQVNIPIPWMGSHGKNQFTSGRYWSKAPWIRVGAICQHSMLGCECIVESLVGNIVNRSHQEPVEKS